MTNALGTLLITCIPCLITGFFTYWAATAGSRHERLRRHLRRALEDVAAFHRLETLYTEELEFRVKDGPTALAWKRVVRAKLRATGYASPSSDATAQKADAGHAAMN